MEHPLRDIPLPNCCIFIKHIITLISTNGDEQWDSSQPVVWKVENPDDANPLHYDLFCKADRDTQYFPLATGLIDTKFR